MSKKKKRISAETKENRGPQRIKSQADRAGLDELMRFSFKFYVTNHEVFHCRDRDSEYFLKFLERIEALSACSVSSLINTGAKSLRFHRIDWNDSRVSQEGFGVKGWEEYEEDAWQFSITSNEHGRVHGFLIDHVFYVVWFDPNHKLYPGT